MISINYKMILNKVKAPRKVQTIYKEKLIIKKKNSATFLNNNNNNSLNIIQI